MNMKSSKKINFLLVLIISGLIIALIVVSKENKSIASIPKNETEEHFQLIEVKIHKNKATPIIHGIITSSEELEVKMNVGGRIDNDNHSLKMGTKFKKNDILIKVDRLEVLYELLISRLNYKKQLQNSLGEIGKQFPDEKDKWSTFENKIERTLPLPDLPKVTSKEEEDLLTQLTIYETYYKIKKTELKTEDYIYSAPFDGFISESSIRPGALIKANTSLMKLSKSNTLQVTSHLPIHLVKDYELAEYVYFLNSNNDTLGKGRFSRLGNKLSDSSYVEVDFNIAEQNHLLENTLIHISLPHEETHNTVTLPKSAVKNSIVQLFLDNKIIEHSIQIVSSNNDSIEVKGLPNHCYVIN